MGWEQLGWGIDLQDCLLGFLVILGLCCLAYYYMASPSAEPWSHKFKNNIRSEAILRDFERQYKEGKITQAQYEDVLRKYFEK